MNQPLFLLKFQKNVLELVGSLYYHAKVIENLENQISFKHNLQKGDIEKKKNSLPFLALISVDIVLFL